MPGPLNIPKRPGLSIKEQNQGVIKESSVSDKLNNAASQALAFLKRKSTKTALTNLAAEAGNKIIKGGARLNLLSMMLSPKSASANAGIVDAETGINKFTGKTEFTPF